MTIKKKWENKLNTTTMNGKLISSLSTKNYFLSSAHSHGCVTSLMSTKHLMESIFAIFELYFELRDNDSDVDKLD